VPQTAYCKGLRAPLILRVNPYFKTIGFAYVNNYILYIYYRIRTQDTQNYN